MRENIKNIVFDLGDVILNINIPLTIQAFSRLSGKTMAELEQIFVENEVFRRIETGTFSPESFREFVRDLLQLPALTDAEIDHAWNALLLDVPHERITLLEKLSANYRLFLLSNTSHIHIEEVHRILQKTAGIPSLHVLFEKVFLSYEIGLMKPDPAIYQTILNDAGLTAGETLFLDDNAANIASAAALGIRTIHVQKPSTILEYLQPYVI